MTAEELGKMTDEQLRQKVTEALEEGPWQHKWSYAFETDKKGPVECRCARCNQQPQAIVTECPVPPPASGSMADLAERLRERVKDISWKHKRVAFMQMAHAGRITAWEACHGWNAVDWDAWFAWYATPRQRVECCLLGLQEDQ